MAQQGRPLPAAAQAIATAVTAAVRAAQAQDAEALTESGDRAARQDPEAVRLVLGSVVRALVEQAHPDGIGADDLGDLLQKCLRTAAPWWPVQPETLVAVLAGALGVHPDTDAVGPGIDVDDQERPPRPTPTDVTCAAALLAAELLPTGGVVTPFVDAAFAEIARAETVELP